MLLWDDCVSMKRTWTDEEISEFIKERCDGISIDGINEIRNEFIYNRVPLEISISRYNRVRQLNAWNSRKDKKYYRVGDGYKKIVYMCEEAVKDLYGDRYQLMT